jgi:DNA-binding NtrC family response regulator
LDTRVISATNVDLEQEVKKGTFREDLYYRLNVIPINLPPLRDRKEDIFLLARHFLEKNCREMKRRLMSMDKEACEALEMYQWPGNVRELENAIERIVALTDGDHITLHDLPPNMARAYDEQERASTMVTEEGVDMAKAVSDIERKMITDALTLAKGVKARAAAMLKLNRTTLVEKMKRLGME